jgi:hypothetical protein
MAAIQSGTRAEDAIVGMDLIHSKPEYKTNTKTVHWSGADVEDLPADFIESAIAEPSILAIWKGNNKLVFAWVEA